MDAYFQNLEGEKIAIKDEYEEGEHKNCEFLILFIERCVSLKLNGRERKII